MAPVRVMKSVGPAGGQQLAPAPQGQDATVRPALSKRAKRLGLRRCSQQVGAAVAGRCGLAKMRNGFTEMRSKLDAAATGQQQIAGLLNTLISRPEDQDTKPSSRPLHPCAALTNTNGTRRSEIIHAAGLVPIRSPKD